eukprot:GHVN01105585.1.p1 GENE.GHVN01105585.1~~GHVN01105585.1.p1  ORF type:complete len:303 (+),score=25.44 GHVN01105585.1:75-983(+)
MGKSKDTMIFAGCVVASAIIMLALAATEIIYHNPGVLLYSIITMVATTIAAVYIFVWAIYAVPRGIETLRIAAFLGLVSAWFLGYCFGISQVHYYTGAGTFSAFWIAPPLVNSFLCAALALWCVFGVEKYKTTCRFSSFIIVTYLCGTMALTFATPSLNDYVGAGWLGVISGVVILALFFDKYRYTKSSTIVLITLIGLLILFTIIEGILLAVRGPQRPGGNDEIFDIITRLFLIVAVSICLVFKTFFLPEQSRPVRLSESLMTAASGVVVEEKVGKVTIDLSDPIEGGEVSGGAQVEVEVV